MTPVVAIAPQDPPLVGDFIETLRVMYGDNDFRKKWVLDNGAVLDFYPQIDGFTGVPTVADFGAGKYRRQVIFDTTSPCDYYYLDSGNVHKCNPTVIAYTGQPPASAFGDGVEYIKDRSNPCDTYYLDSGNVTKCPSGGGDIYQVGVRFDNGYGVHVYRKIGILPNTVTYQFQEDLFTGSIDVVMSLDGVLKWDVHYDDFSNPDTNGTVNLTANVISTVNIDVYTDGNGDWGVLTLEFIPNGATWSIPM